MTRSSRLHLCYAAYALGIIAWAVSPALSRWSSDVESGRRVVSRHLLTEMPLTSGIEEISNLLHPVPEGRLLLEVELTMDRDDLQEASPWDFATPFEWEFDFHTEDGRQVYSGLQGTLTVLRDPVEAAGLPSPNRVRVVNRHVIHRALDMGPVVVRIMLSAPSPSSFEDAVFRIYDDLETGPARVVSRATYPLTVYSPFAALLGLVSFVVVTRSDRRAACVHFSNPNR